MPQHGLLQHLEGLGDEQSGGAVSLADHSKHEEGAALEGGVVEEGRSGVSEIEFNIIIPFRRKIW